MNPKESFNTIKTQKQKSTKHKKLQQIISNVKNHQPKHVPVVSLSKFTPIGDIHPLLLLP